MVRPDAMECVLTAFSLVFVLIFNDKKNPKILSIFKQRETVHRNEVIDKYGKRKTKNVSERLTE